MTEPELKPQRGHIKRDSLYDDVTKKPKDGDMIYDGDKTMRFCGGDWWYARCRWFPKVTEEAEKK